MSFKRNIATRGWHVYGKTVQKNSHRGEKLEAKKEYNNEGTKIDPYAIAWTVKRKHKIAPVAVGHIPKEISRFTKFFLNQGERIEAKVFSSQYKPSLISLGELKILLVVRFSISEEKPAILKHLQNFHRSKIQRVNVNGYITK